MSEDLIHAKYPHLRKQETSHGKYRKNPWTLENLENGFHYFFDLFGHFPTIPEINSFGFLPTARSIERSFGGVVKVRELLNLAGQKDFRKGEARSNIAVDRYRKASQYEESFHKYLIEILPEILIHEQKVLRPGNVSSDFFIYTSAKDGVVIDLFYAQNILNACNIVRIKNKRYGNIQFPILFISIGNDSITQNGLDRFMSNKKVLLRDNIKVITEQEFKNNFTKYIKIMADGFDDLSHIVSNEQKALKTVIP